MADQKLIEEVGKYIDKYYKPAYSDIKMDKEMLSVFEKITKYREKRAEEKRLQEKIWISFRQKKKFQKNLMFQRYRRQK